MRAMVWLGRQRGAPLPRGAHVHTRERDPYRRRRVLRANHMAIRWRQYGVMAATSEHVTLRVDSVRRCWLRRMVIIARWRHARYTARERLMLAKMVSCEARGDARA